MSSLEQSANLDAEQQEAAEIRELESSLGVVDSSGKEIPDETEVAAVDPKTAALERSLGLADKADEAEAQDASQPSPAEGEAKSQSLAKTTFQTVYGIPHATARAMGKAGEELVNSVIDVADWVENKGAEFGIGDGKLIPDGYKIDVVDQQLPESELGSLNLYSNLVQFLAPYGAVSKAMKVGKAASAVGKVTKAASAGMIADFVSQAPDEGHISDFLQKTPWLAPIVSDYLTTQKDDSRAEGRFKNAIEGLGLGLAAEGVFHVFRSVAKGTNIKVAEKELQKSFEKAAKDVGPDGKILAEPQIEFKFDEPKKIDMEPLAPAKGDFVELAPENVVKSGPANKSTGNINLNKLDTETNVQQAMDNWGSANKDFLENARGGRTDEEELVLLAQDLSTTPESLRKVYAKDGALNAIQLTQARQFLVASGEDLALKAKKAVSGSDADIAAFLDAQQAYASISETVSGATAEAGRSLRSLRKVVSADEKFQADMLKQLINTHGGRESAQKTAKRVAEISSLSRADFVKEYGKLVKKSYFAKINEAVYETWIGNILAGPATHVKNIFSNSVNVGLHYGEEFLAEAFGHSTKGSAKAFRQGAQRAAIDETRIALRQGVQNVADFFGMSKYVSQETKQNTIKSGLEKTERFAPAVTGKNLIPENFDSWPFSDSLRFVVDKVGQVGRGSLVALESADDVFKSVSYRGHLSQLGYTEGLKKNLAGAELNDFIESFMKSPPDNIRFNAEQFANKQTFTSPLEGHWATLNSFTNIGSGTKLFGNVGPLKYLIPFSRTNLNIALQGLERTPFSLLMGETKKALKIGGKDAFIAKARIAYGSTFFAGVGMMAANGSMTGDGPKDYRKRKLWLQNNQPYSIKVGDTWIAYGEMGALAPVLKAAADVGTILSYDDPSDPQSTGVAEVFSSLVGNLLTPEFLSDSINTLHEMLFGDKGTQKRAQERFFSELAINATPIAGNKALTAVRKNIDPVRRDYYTQGEHFDFFQKWADGLKNNIPGLSESLPPVRNLWGEPVEFPAGFANGFVDPFYMTESSKDPIMQEITRLGGAGLADAKNFKEDEKHLTIDMPQKFIKIAGQSIKLTGEQYSKYVELAAGVGLKPEYSPGGGKNLRDALNNLVKNEFDGLDDKTKLAAIKSYIAGYRKAARAQMQEEMFSPENQMKDIKLKKINNNLAPYDEVDSGGADVSF